MIDSTSPPAARGASDSDPAAAIELCRQGQWDRGLPVLSQLAEDGAQLSGLAYSYLGYGVALSRRQVREGRRLCRHAVRIEFYQPENYLNLARTELLANDRRAAFRALESGLALDPEHTQLLALRSKMGRRRSSSVPFLSRGNLVNRVVGRIRHAFGGD